MARWDGGYQVIASTRCNHFHGNEHSGVQLVVYFVRGYETKTACSASSAYSGVRISLLAFFYDDSSFATQRPHGRRAQRSTHVKSLTRKYTLLTAPASMVRNPRISCMYVEFMTFLEPS